MTPCTKAYCRSQPSEIWSSGLGLIGASGTKQHAAVLQKEIHSTELKHRKVMNLTMSLVLSMSGAGQWCEQMLLVLAAECIDAKSLLPALRNKQKTEPPFLYSSVQNTVNQRQTLGWIKKHRSIIFLLVSYGHWLGRRRSSKGYAQKCRLPDHVYDDTSPWQLHRPRNGFLNDYSISSNRATLAMSIVTLYLLSELGFQFSRSLEFSYSCGQIRALN